MARTANPFESRWLQVPAGRMHYVDEGTGDPVLFVHGTPTWSFDWRHLIAALSPHRRCIAPDLIGFGHSDRPRDFAYTPEAHAEALAEFVERLELRNFTLVVHDFGGPIALPLALRNASPVSRLIVFNSWMWRFAGDRFPDRGSRGAVLWTLAKSLLGSSAHYDSMWQRRARLAA